MRTNLAYAAREAARPFRAPARDRRDGTSFSLDRPAALSHMRLLAAVTRRDTGSFIALFNYYAPRIKAYMRRLGTSEAGAEDLAQEAMFTVWRKSVTYDPAKSAVNTWIFTIARNLRIDALRRDHMPALDAADPSLAPQPAPQPDVEVESLIRGARVREALHTLPRDQAAVVSLAFWQGKSHGEIADTLHIPLGTVKSRMRLAFNRIRGVLVEAS